MRDNWGPWGPQNTGKIALGVTSMNRSRPLSGGFKGEPAGALMGIWILGMIMNLLGIGPAEPNRGRANAAPMIKKLSKCGGALKIRPPDIAS